MVLTTEAEFLCSIDGGEDLDPFGELEFEEKYVRKEYLAIVKHMQMEINEISLRKIDRQTQKKIKYY